MARDELEVVIDQGSLTNLLRGIRRFDKNLSTQTRKNLRAAAKPAVDDVKAHWREGGPSRKGLRARLVRGTKLQILTGRRERLSIVTRGELARAWDARGGFRHPTFGGDPWVTQQGNPGFGRVTARHVPSMRQAVAKALQDAVDQMNRETS